MRQLLEHAGVEADKADSGAVTLIQRFGSAASLTIRLRCLFDRRPASGDIR